MAHSEETARAVLADIAAGMSVKKAAESNGVGETTFYQWAAGQGAPYTGFAEDYARATSIRTERMAEEILDISDDDSLDIGFDDEGKPFVKGENIQRSKLRVDTRKWLMAKMMPKKYGDSTQIKHADADGEKLKCNGKSDDELNSRISELASKAGAGGAACLAGGEAQAGDESESS